MLRNLKSTALVVTTLCFAGILACSGKRSSPRAAPAATPPAADPSATPTPTPTPDPDKGETTPEIKDDTVTTIETDTDSKTFHMVFPAETQDLNGHYLEEYLLVVRATEDSCVRIKVRPSGGITDGLNGDDIAEEIEGACGVGSSETTETAPATEGAAASLWGETENSINPLSLLEFNGSVRLAADAPVPCARRLFRMPQKVRHPLGTPKGLDSIVTKTGQYIVESTEGLVRVWFDEEVGNFCSGSTVLPSINYTPFLAAQTNSAYRDPDHKDKIFKEHIQNLANESEKILKSITTVYGPVSDVDQNRVVDIFISPEINRNFFTTDDGDDAIDSFESALFYKYQDLADYSPSQNPLGNEGEIVYMWAPDPAGLFRYTVYPSSNSLTTNYAKGYVAAQFMHLIIANQRLFINKVEPEDDFLLTSLAYLASDYYAGTDYTLRYKGHYLTSRPQNFGLDGELDKTLVPSSHLWILQHQREGMRAVFGWYLHTKLCGTTVTPCAELKQFWNRSTHGVESIEAVLGMSFNEVLSDFGNSVGIALTTNPTATLERYKTERLDGMTTQVPPVLPYLTRILAEDPRVTAEADNIASALLSVDANDHTWAGPFPNRTSLLFQPLFPDFEMDVELKKDSVTPLIVTGLITQTTDVTAWVGPKTRINIVPLGARDTDYRQVWREKVSESAHLDLRPFNLTSQAATPNTTYFRDPEPNAHKLKVDAKRELWIVGSIDNTKVDVQFQATDVSDTDSYNVEINPCENATNVATCQAQTYVPVVVQVYALDHHRELLPMTMWTTTNLDVFRGFAIPGLIDKVDPEFKIPSNDDMDVEEYHVVCESAAIADNNDIDSGEKARCGNGGILPDAFRTAAGCSDATSLSLGLCPWKPTAPNLADSFFYDSVVWRETGRFGLTIDNYLYSGPAGYPYFNHRTFSILGERRYWESRQFIQAEVDRQFFKWGYEKDIKINSIYLYPTLVGSAPAIEGDPLVPVMNLKSLFSEDRTIMSSDLISAAITIQDAVENPIDPPSEDLEAACGQFEIASDQCVTAVGTNDATNELNCTLAASLRNYISTNNLYIMCNSLSSGVANCSGYSLTRPLSLAAAGGAGIPAVPASCNDPLLGASRFVAYARHEDAITVNTYYVPTRIGLNDTTTTQKKCAGLTSTTATELFTAGCPIELTMGGVPNDIRTQIAVPWSAFQPFCWAPTEGTSIRLGNPNLQVCADPPSAYTLIENSSEEKHTGAFWLYGETSTDLVRARPIAIDERVGEVVGVRDRMHPLVFYVPAAQNSIVHIMVGGRKQSQGKYVLRVRTYDSTYKAFAP